MFNVNLTYFRALSALSGHNSADSPPLKKRFDFINIMLLKSLDSFFFLRFFFPHEDFCDNYFNNIIIESSCDKYFDLI